MTVQHHLDRATIVRFASGDLDEAFSVIVASHIAMCPSCRSAVKDVESIGGQFLEQAEEAPISDGSFDTALKKIETSGDANEVDGTFNHSAESDVPKPLRRFVGNSLHDISWSMVAPGLKRHSIDLNSKGPSSLYLLQIAAGKAVPEHGHGGSEMTLVLSGKYRDALGVFGPGDIEDLDEHVEHQPKVEPEEACICLVATEAPTRFKGFFSRLLQPLVGI